MPTHTGEDMVNNMIQKRNGIALFLIGCLLLVGAVSATTIELSGVSISGAGQSASIPITIDTVSTGLAGYKLNAALSSSGVAKITAVTMPDWASMKNVDGTLPGESVNITAVDLSDTIKSGATNVPVATLTVEGVAAGSTNLVLTISELTDDSGNAIQFSMSQAGIVVGGSSSTTTPSPTPTITSTITATITPTPTATITSSPTATPTQTVTETPTLTTVPTITPAPTQTIVQQATPTPVPTVIANFTADITSGASPMTVRFTDLSEGYPTKFFWNFGDNSSDSTSVVENPQHIYRIPGIYSVSLNASNSQYSNETSRANYIVAGNMRMPQRGDKTSMTIYSVPDGAECYLNNAYQGITPVNVTNLTPRTYQLRLHKEGYYDIVDPVIANKGVLPTFVSGYEMLPHYAEIGNLVADPPQTGAAYIVTYPELVTTYIDDKNVGKTDVMVLNLAVGTHNLTLVKDGYANWTDTLDVRNGLAVIQSYFYDQPYFPPTNKTVEYVNMSP